MDLLLCVHAKEEVCYFSFVLLKKWYWLWNKYYADISPAEVSKFAEIFCTTCSCVIKIVEPRAGATLDDLRAAVLKVNTLEEEKRIPPWDDEYVPEEIVTDKPSPGYALTD